MDLLIVALPGAIMRRRGKPSQPMMQFSLSRSEDVEAVLRILRIMKISIPLFVAVLTAAYLGGTALAQQNSADTASKRAPKFTEAGTEGCLVCHSGERMSVVAATVHGNAENPHSPYTQQGCESCHGPGSFHVSRAHGGLGFRHVVKFGAGGPDRSSASDQVDACLGCHGKSEGGWGMMVWKGTVHDKIGLACSNCHEMHSETLSVTDQKQQSESCYACHGAQRETHPRFEDKGIDIDRLNCTVCHDVHQLGNG
jgi:hypothetical protein